MTRLPSWLAGLLAVFVLAVACNVPLPPGRVCNDIGPTGNLALDCNCYVYAQGWKLRSCPSPSPTPEPTPGPVPTPSPTPGPVPTPTPNPSPVPTPTPQPTPTPCISQTVVFPACGGDTSDCWSCAARIAWDMERHSWEPLPGTNLLFNHPGGDPTKWEYLDRNCNLVDRNGNVLRPAAQQFGEGCHGNVLCPPDERVTIPCPSPEPTPGPTPPPGECPACPGITAIVGKVHQYQWQHQTVPFHQEGDTWVARGPVDRVNWDSTIYYGCAAPRCDSEHNHCLAKCEDLRGPRYRVVSGPLANCQAENPGDDGRGFALSCDMTQPFGEVVVEVCTVAPWISTETGEHIPGQACKTLRGRVDP